MHCVDSELSLDTARVSVYGRAGVTPSAREESRRESILKGHSGTACGNKRCHNGAVQLYWGYE